MITTTTNVSSTSPKSFSMKRIANDILEITNYPLEGIGIAPIDEDSMNYVANIQFMSGLLEGYCIQLLLTFSDSYPTLPPKVRIYPDQALNSSNCYGIHTQEDGFKSISMELLDDNVNSNQISAWNPSYTISTLLLQLQNYLTESVYGMNSLKETLMKSMDSYQREFAINDGKGTVKHTWKNPFPRMHFMKDDIEMITNELSRKDASARRKQIIKENLTCFMLRDNYIDNGDIILGYPIVKSIAQYGKNQIELYPIPQLLSYEAYTMQTLQLNQNYLMVFYENERKLKSPYNQYYNTWLPIYVDQKHFSKNREAILNCIRDIKGENEFKTSHIFEVLPIILNKMIIGMFNGKSVISTSFITCYFQYVLLFRKLCQEFQADYQNYVNAKIESIELNNYEVSKSSIPDIGNFFMLMFFSNKESNSDSMKKLKLSLFEEFHTRMMYWIFHGPECSATMRQLLLSNSINDTEVINSANYDSYQVELMLKSEGIKNSDEILKYAYESQRGNQLLLTTFFALKKMEEMGFMDELENSYGIYLNIDQFIEELKVKLGEIKSFKSLYEFIGTEFGKDKTELQLLIDGYVKAKSKGYIRAYFYRPRYNYRYRGFRRRYYNGNNRNRYNFGYRGRGRKYRGYGYWNRNRYRNYNWY